MKSRRFFASAALLLLGISGYCCGPYWYYPEEYYIYRAHDGSESTLSLSYKQENINRWKALYPEASTGDIEEVVYKWNLDKLLNMEKNRRSNKFANCICESSDIDVVDYLVVAKKCELSCAERASKWYYPFKNDPDIAALEEVIKQAQNQKSGELYDRYILQEVRALFSLSRHEDIIRLWEACKGNVQPGIIRDMIIGYVAGSSYRIGDETKAMQYYLNIGDVSSVRYCLARKGEIGIPLQRSVLALFAKYCPDSPEIPRLLQEIFYGFEDNWYDYTDYYRWQEHNFKQRMTAVRGYADCTRKFFDICMEAAGNSQSPAIWYYTSAFLADLLGSPQKASVLIGSAEKTCNDKFLEESIKVFRIYLDARLSTYNKAYEARLLEQLRWLDGKIIGELDEDSRRRTCEDTYYMSHGFSYYYWNDMLRKILIGEVCPRMEEAGKSELCLRLLNMADNRLLGFVNKHVIYTYSFKGEEYVEEKHSMSLSQYRQSQYFNTLDYSNYFFNAMDDVPITSLVRYATTVGASSNPLEKFLDERSYIDKDYLYELIGTRYLREQNYVKAESWLSKVADSYQRRTNISSYMTLDPFVLESDESYTNENYKLSFAREMASLQKKSLSEDPDIRGEAMVRMGVGLRSSFTNCWPLTQYHKYLYDEWIASKETLDAIKKADNMIDTGLKTIKDPEKAAAAYLSQYMYLSVAEKYPETQVCKKMKAECDKLYDHKRPLPHSNVY